MKQKHTEEKKQTLRKKRKEKRQGLIAEFRKFITRGNVLDMAVGVIIATAFTKIVNSFTKGLIMPLVNWIVHMIVGDMDLNDITTVLHRVTDDAGKLDLNKSIIISWGTFIQSIIDFLLIALVLFVILKFMNSLKDKRLKLEEKLKKRECDESEEDAMIVVPEDPVPTVNEQLNEIIDILKEKKAPDRK